MWHKAASARDEKARDIILHDDKEEYIALLAITIEVMRWLTRLLQCSTAQRLEIVNRSQILIYTFASRPRFLRSAIHIVVFDTKNFVDMRSWRDGKPHVNEALRT